MGLSFLICVIYFADSLLSGLVMPFTTTIILNLGGTHLDVGILGTIRTILQLLSSYFLRTFADVCGYKTALISSLFVTLQTFVILDFTTTHIVAMYARSIFYFVNQTQMLCKRIVRTYEPAERHRRILAMMHLLNGVALIGGPFVSGYLFEDENGLKIIAFIASIVTVFSIGVCLYLPSLEYKAAENEDIFFKDFWHSLRNMFRIQWKKNWHIFAANFFVTMAFIAYCGKFPMLLVEKFEATPSVVGRTHAFHNATLLITRCFVKPVEKVVRPITFFTKCLVLVFVFMLALCFAPTYDYYLHTLSMLLLCHTYVDLGWKEYLEAMPADGGNNFQAAKNINTLSNIISPPIIGKACDVYAHNAVQVFSIMPLAIAALLASRGVHLKED